MKLRKVFLIITLFFATTISTKALGGWVGDFCEDCGEYGKAGLCDKVHNTNVGLFRVTFYLNGEKLGSSVNVSRSATYQQNALAASYHWGDGLTDIVSYAKGTSLSGPVSGGLDSIIIKGISTSNVQTILDPSKNSKNVQIVLEQAGITDFSFKNGKIYYKPPDGECDGDYEIQMIVEAMQIINWRCNSSATASYAWIGTPYELNNGLLALGYNSHTGGNGYMSGSVVDKTLLSSLRIDENVKIGDISFSAVTDCLTVHIRGYDATEGYGFNVYNLTGKFEIDCDKKCCIPCEGSKEECKAQYGDNYHEDDPYCCYTDEQIEDENVCINYDDYWNKYSDKYDDLCGCKVPEDDPTYCCEDPTWKKKHPDEYKRLCTTPQLCNIGSVTPEMTLDQCDTENDENVSHFRDGAFSEKGMFNDINTYKDLTSDKVVDDENKTINENILDRIESSRVSDDDTFQTIAALFATGDESYSYKLTDYCNMHCQEVFDVTLPDNFPKAEAGRYFYWKIKNSRNIITKASEAKLCAVDIDLDKAIDDYLDASDDARAAAQNELNFFCYDRTAREFHRGVGDFSGAFYPDCDTYHNEYVSFADDGFATCFPGINKDGHYGDKIDIGTTTCCEGKDENGNDINCHPGPLYIVKENITPDDAIENVYQGADVYNVGEYACNPPLPIKDYHSIINPIKYQKMSSTSAVPPMEWCLTTLGYYQTFVQKYAESVDYISGSISICNQMGDAIIELGVDLTYQTLFTEEETFSTTDNTIVEMSSSKDYYYNYKCIQDKKDCEKDMDNNGYADTYFYMNPDLLPEEGGRKFESSDLDCENTVNYWGTDKRNPGGTRVKDPNYSVHTHSITGGIPYNPSGVHMKNCNDYIISDGTKSDPKGMFVCDTDFYLVSAATGDNLWNTIYASLITAEKEYALERNINACICKNGEVKDMEDDKCECDDYVEHMDYDEFIKTFNNYQTLPDGTLSVEFMNGTGLYPISLKYWNIGSLDSDDNGHFEPWLIELSEGICNNDGDEIKCLYGDPYKLCRFVIINKIIAVPDGDCDEGDCDICEGEICDDICDDEGNCKVPNCYDTYGEASEECTDVAGLNLIYRAIDLDFPFPGLDGSGRTLPKKSNWYGNETIITDNRGVNGSALYTSNLEPLYSAELTPAVIKAIRTDSARLSPDYLSSTVIYPNSTDNPDVVGGGYSLFVHNFRFNNQLVITSTLEDDERFANIRTTGGD